MKRLVFAILFTIGNLAAEDWSQWLGNDRSGIWKETGIIEKFPEGGPKVLWRTNIGAGYAGPAVADGKVYVLDRHLAPNAANAENPFQRNYVPGTENVICLNSSDGKVLWKHGYESNYTVSYAAGPRTTPTVEDTRVYTLGAEGQLFCIDNSDGKVLWEKNLGTYLNVKTPVWGYAASPLIYKDLLICLGGGRGSVAIAFDKHSGDEIWRSLSAKEPGYCPPTLINHGGKDQLIIWHPESINALEPDSGKVIWTLPWQIRSGLSIPTPQLDGDHLFFTAFYNGSTMLKLKADHSRPDIMWQTEHVSEKRTTHLNSIMPTPVLRNGVIFGTCSYGEFRCLDQKTGERLWESMAPSTGSGRKLRWFNNFMTPNGDRDFLFSERGDLVIAKIDRAGYREIDRVHLIEPNGDDMRQRSIVWSHPAYAQGCAFIRNDSEIICVDLKK